MGAVVLGVSCMAPAGILCRDMFSMPLTRVGQSVSWTVRLAGRHHSLVTRPSPS